MLKKELFSICTFYAISPVHAGSGAATSTVDLPIQRERHTNWPHIQASAVKGAVRAHYRKFAGDKNADIINLIFGSDSDNDKEKQGAEDGLPGALSVSDAKLFAFPMRSNIAPFVWVTCPAVLKRLKNDFKFVQMEETEAIPDFKKDEAILLNGNMNGEVILEDAVAKITETAQIPKILSVFTDIENLILISDEMFDYCVSSCTEVQTYIKIDSKKGTVDENTGGLWYQELLPADSMLYSVVYYSGVDMNGSDMNELQASTIKGHIEEVVKEFIQVGGDETLGRGICKISWINGGVK